MNKTIIIGSRGSKLALWQAHFVQQQLKALGQPSDIKIIKTKGDAIQNMSFDKMEGKGFFTAEIEHALLSKEIDLAVHSLKDLQTQGVEGLTLAAVSERANPADWLIIHPDSYDESQPMRIKKGAVIGTSSARRKAQLLHFRPDIQIQDIRGNVPTRIKKIHTENLDGAVLAAAGITRLEIDLKDYKVFEFNPKEFVSAPAQGVLGLQVREEDITLRKVLSKMHHAATSSRTNIERSVLKLLGGGCQTPLGVYCETDDLNNYHVWAAYAKQWNSPVQHIQASSATSSGLAEAVIEKIKAT